MAAHHPITTVRVGNDDVEIRPGEPLMADGHDWSWAFVVFAPVPGHPGELVGSDGSWWTEFRNGTPRRTPGIWRRRRFQVRVSVRGGALRYAHVNLRVEGRQKKFRVHRLIAAAFFGPCPGGMECCHNNGDSLDNRVRNLRWDSRQSNNQDVMKHGRLRRGESSPGSRLRDADVAEMRALAHAGEDVGRIARRFGLHRIAAYNVIAGRRWKHLNGIYPPCSGSDRPRPVKPPAPCIVCGSLAKPLRRGRCGACRAYWENHGVERPDHLHRRSREKTS